MNLGQVRTQFAKITGRMDLITGNLSSNTDNGANFYINAGQKFLDQRVQNHRSRGSTFTALSIGVYYANFLNCRSIEEVWVNDTAERWQLEKKSLIWLRNEYPDVIASTDYGTPLYYAPVNIRGISVTSKDSLGLFFNYVLTQTGYEDYTGLMILPAPDTAVVLETIGLWYEPELTVDAGESYWTVNYPDLLVMAASYKLEVMYRNTQGAKDWLGAIELALQDIDKDVVNQEWAETNQIEG